MYGHLVLQVTDLDAFCGLPSHVQGTVWGSNPLPEGWVREDSRDPMRLWTTMLHSLHGPHRIAEAITEIDRERVQRMSIDLETIEGVAHTEQRICKGLICDAFNSVYRVESPGEILFFEDGVQTRRIEVEWDLPSSAPFSLSWDETYTVVRERDIGRDQSGRPNQLTVEAGEDSVNQTVAYGNFGEVVLERHSDGNRVRHVYDQRGRLEQTYRGTNDQHPFCGTAAPAQSSYPDNMVLTESSTTARV